MDIEKLATSAIVDSISLTDVLSPFINDGDKEPSWDGNIYIYKDKKKNKNGIKKVPVQVKGEVRKRVPPNKKPKYSVKLPDLENWQNDGGIMLFVVLIDKSGTKKAIYYSALVPVLIRHLKQFSRGKKSINVTLKEFPIDNHKKVSVLLDFYNHMQKQTSFANAPLYTIEELEKEGVLENISFTVTTYGRLPNFKDVEDIILQNNLYMYAKVKGSSVPQPLPDIPTNIHIAKDVLADVKVKNQVFYTRYKIIRYAEGFDINIGRSIILKIHPEKKKGSLNFRIKGTLSDYIRDTEFIIAIIENRVITVNGVDFPFDDIGDANVEQYRFNLQYYKDVKKMLKILGVKEELECENLSEQDQINIRNFTNSLVLGGNIGFPNRKEDIVFGRFPIGNLILLIWADRIKNSSESYNLQSFFSEHRIALFEGNDKEGKKPYPITHYVLLKKKDFLEVANIDYEVIIDDIPNNDTSPIVTEQLILFMLEMLKAYDEQKKKEEGLLNAASAYCDWLIEHTDKTDGIMELNRLQIIKRRRELNNTEISQLNELRRLSKNLAVKCGANILLGKMEMAQECFDEMERMVKEQFLEYPICQFGKPNFVKSKDDK